MIKARVEELLTLHKIPVDQSVEIFESGESKLHAITVAANVERLAIAREFPEKNKA